MKILNRITWCAIIGVLAASLCANLFAPAPYARQFRESPNARPSRQFPLGTDALGRDRLSRLLYGGRVSLLLAPAAALLSMVLAGVIGTFAGFMGGGYEQVVLSVIDLFISLPWLFLLIIARSLLPLDVSPSISIVVTFVLLSLLGWAASARVVCAGVRKLKASSFVMMARATGCGRIRTMLVHILPNLKPVLWAQFLVAVPVFILAEANLTILGLGVGEPLPSWGGSLKELEGTVNLLAEPWRLVPLALLVFVVWSFQVVISREEGIA